MQTVWKHAPLRAAILAALALGTLSAPAKADFQTEFLASVNEYRQSGDTCPDAMGTASPLITNILLNTAAAQFAEALAQADATPDEVLNFSTATGYLHWRVTTGVLQTRLREPTGSFFARSQVRNEASCRSLLAPNLSEIGIGTFNGGEHTVIVFIAARPFRRDLLAAYRQEFLDRINAMREKGVTCHGQAIPPQPPVFLSPDLTEVAQDHSDDMATWPYPGDTETPDPYIGRDGSTSSDRINAMRCESENTSETIAINVTDPDRTLLSMTGPYGIATVDQCRAIMATAPHIGIGIAQTPELAETEFGRGPWLTITTGELGERCTARAAAAALPETEQVEFDPELDYRVINIGSQTPLALSARPGNRNISGRRRDTAFLDAPSLDRAQKWRITSVQDTHASYQTTHLMTSGYRGKDLKLTTATGQNPFALSELDDQDANSFARISQHWQFAPVPGMPNTYTIANLSREGIVLGATGDGRLTFTQPSLGNLLTYWRITPIQD